MSHAPGPPLEQARRLLQAHFGHADFRAPQQRVLEAALAGRDVLGVLPTGAGKSVCFQLPALLDPGLTLVISPLISLMQDQVAAAQRRGLPAVALAGAMDPARREEVLVECVAGRWRLLYVAPERLPGLAPRLRELRVARLVVDEAHCISEWGHDFRPAFRRLGQLRQALGHPPVLALTGSATPVVRDDIARVLGIGPGGSVIVTSFDRRNLRFEVVPVRDDAAARLAEVRRALPPPAAGLGIVYVPTRRLTVALARALRQAGCRAQCYHAGLPAPWRESVLRGFLGGRLDVVIATCAFGMGIDAPNVRAVVHWSLPPTPESYYQEAGRAGRDGAPARCVLLHAPGDGALHRRLLDVTFPPRALLRRLWEEPGLRHRVPAPVVAAADRLHQELRPDQGQVDWRPVAQRRRAAEARLAAMEQYATTRGCRRAALLGWFGEALRRCSGCDRCEAPPVTRGLRGLADRFRTGL